MDQKIDENYKRVVKIKMALMFGIMFSLPFLPMTIMFGWMSSSFVPELQILFYVFLILIICLPLIAYIIGALYANAWYNNFSFELEKEGLRIFSGVITKTQKFIPYEKIQDITVQSGYWERRYGLSTILIETAGSAGYVYKGRVINRPEGVIPGLRDPEPIMDEIKSKMGKGSSGL